MGLEEIAAAAGTTTHRQCDRGVPTVDQRGAALADRLAPFEAQLPCSAAAAATLLETQTAGTPIGDSASRADLTPVTAAKTLHRLGVEGVCPLAPTARSVVRDWIDGDLTRADAITLADASEEEFALAAYIETHDPIPGARQVTEAVQTPTGDAMVEKRDHLAETMTDPTDLV